MFRTIAKDSCFHFHYLGTKEKRNYNNEVEIEENVPIEKHFDFKLNGHFDMRTIIIILIDNSSYGYALFRDELKAQEDCNPDILIEQEGKDHNPHKQKYMDNNTSIWEMMTRGYAKQWNEKYQLDLIGRDYCRDRSIACDES